ncbi:hypothetical protein SNL152K_91 [Streptomyces sp. NL15-2K]|nr:hypothetical protein SNL152K_91 [Streptomyces sp. NL15-2K]
MPPQACLDVHHVYLSRRIAETRGRISLVALHRELAERGWHGSYSTLRDWAVHRLRHPRRPPQPPPAPPSTRQVTGWLTRRPSTSPRTNTNSSRGSWTAAPS